MLGVVVSGQNDLFWRILGLDRAGNRFWFSVNRCVELCCAYFFYFFIAFGWWVFGPCHRWLHFLLVWFSFGRSLLCLVSVNRF